MSHLQDWVPLEAGMLPSRYAVEVDAEESFPVVLVQNILDGFDRITSPGDTHSRLTEIARHRRKMKRQLETLLSDRFDIDILSRVGPQHIDGFLSVRFRSVDQFGLVEHLWREQQVLASYFCARDVVRFAVDLSTTPQDLQETISRLSMIVPRFKKHEFGTVTEQRVRLHGAGRQADEPA